MDTTTQAIQEPGRRKSVFMEVGLVDEANMRRDRSPAPIMKTDPSAQRSRPTRTVRFRSQHDILGEGEDTAGSGSEAQSGAEDMDNESLFQGKQHSSYSVYQNMKMYRMALLSLVFVLLLPVLQSKSLAFVGVEAGAIPRNSVEPYVIKREDTNTQVCKRWAGQSAVVNGTLYFYAGRASTEAEQKGSTWTNDFLTLDLTKSWQISSPSLTGLPRPSGPPVVSMGHLWNSHDSLFLYGGQFSDEEPKGTPTAFSTWEYKIKSKEWVEHKDPKSSKGKHAPEGDQPVQRASEGSGVTVSTLGRGFYFGGHLDDYTTEGWSNLVKRIYLKSLLEFTFPGYGNKQVESLGDGKKAGEGGVYRNVTEGGLQSTAGFPERADGLLVYIPGFSEEGLLLGLTGGVNETFTQMNVIDVYDIATSTWYKQSTSGKQPKYRVNPCAAVAAAADGSSYNVYMYGGQNLQPFKGQTQYDDMWILSIPSFTWIPVETKDQATPYARAGHSCHVWDGQMVVVGGYVGQDLSCESPGVYVFNMSSLEWTDQFTALTAERAFQHYDGTEGSQGNPLAQQANQRGFDAKAGLEGSYGYAVPAVVQAVIGGKETGGATLTAPVQTPTEGPLKTGKPHTYTVTGPNGAVRTEISHSGADHVDAKRGPNIGAIIAGVIAGVFAVVAAYFAFCAWVYRKQVAIWKNHAAVVTQRSEKQAAGFAAAGGMMTSSSGKNSSDRTARDALFPPTDSSSAGGARTSNEAGPSGFAAGGAVPRKSEDSDDTGDLLGGLEPSFWGPRGVLLNPRRSLRVINRD